MASYRIARRRDLAQASGAYRTKFRWMTCCIYCGMPATDQDHVFPVSIAAGLATHLTAVRRQLKQGLNTVPSCRECNTIAGNNPFVTIREKRAFIQGKLFHRLRKHLEMPEWTPRELAELSYSMRTFVLRGIREAERAHMRLNWPWTRGSYVGRQKTGSARRGRSRAA